MSYGDAPPQDRQGSALHQGPGRILKLARRHRSRYLPHLIRRASKRRFGYDGRNFYAKFMASALILHRTKSFFPKARTKPLHFVKIRLKHPIWVKNLRKVVKLPVSGILLFNPMLVRLLKRRRHPIPAHFPLRLPAGAAKRLQKEARRLAQKGGATLPIKARRGDSVYKIARRFGVPLLVVRDHNKKLLKVSPRCGELNEQRLVWRRWRSKRRRARRRGKRLKRPDGVRRLSRKERRFYARKCRSRRALYRRLPKATVVKIPAYMRASTKPIEIYRVRGSEPLSWIACRACTTVWHLRSLNPSVPIKRLRAGTNLRVPQCPWSRRRLFTACHVHHYSRSRARRSRRSRSRRSRRKRRRRRQANN